MPTQNRPPAYRHYKPKDLAVVRLRGRDIYLGKYDSPSSWREYYRLITEFLAPAERMNVDSEGPPPAPHPISIKKLCLNYYEFAQGEYVKDGKPTGEVVCLKYALRRILKLFADQSAANFSPKGLKLVRDEFVRDGQIRTTVNNNIARIKRMFSWAVENELIPVTTYQAIATVKGLKKGRSAAPEPKKVKPVKDEAVLAALPFMPAPVRAMVELQRIIGCRPSEITQLRPCDVDLSDDCWCYVPHSHKTEHHGCERRIYFGPRSQEILRPWLERDPQSYCFSPKESVEALRRLKQEKRQTPIGQGNRQGTNKKRNPKRQPGVKYSTGSYRRAIARACELAKIEPWRPNQLRHARASEVSKTADIDAARCVLGHSDPRITENYAEVDFTKAADFMRVHG